MDGLRWLLLLFGLLVIAGVYFYSRREKNAPDDSDEGAAKRIEPKLEAVTHRPSLADETFVDEEEDVDADEMWILEPQSMFRGWQCWKDSKPVAKHRWSAYHPDKAIPESQLSDEHGPFDHSIGEGWKEMVGFGVISLDNTDLQVEFSTDSLRPRGVPREEAEELEAQVHRRGLGDA